MLHKKGIALVIFFAFAAGALAYDIRVSRLNSWELTFESRPPRVMSLVEEDTLVNYTYVIYQVTNNTPQEIDFYPTFEIETDDGSVHRAQLFPDIAARLAERFGKDILNTSKIAGIIKPGETKRGVATFKDVDTGSDKLNVYVGGLSGDLKVEREKTDGERVVTLYRTFKSVYYRPGDEFDVEIDPVILESSEWVWRE